MPPVPEHVFVLLLENRSFDHLFGFSGIKGFDASTGRETSLDGLSGAETNRSGGATFRVADDATFVPLHDPPHEFPDVRVQLCGPEVPPAASYPPITNGGFVESYRGLEGTVDLRAVMAGFDTAKQLPVLFALAEEFAICDRWFSSMPGPTWPNRMFAHAASAGGIDHSPSTLETVAWETVNGFHLENGSIFDALKAKGKSFRLYSGEDFPLVLALKGICVGDVHRMDTLFADLEGETFPYDYVFIEPSYDLLHSYRKSTSQHPLADVRAGEGLVKTVYEALRASRIWENSLLVIAWDEHGGFYDHVPPPPAVPPGDTIHASNTRHGFTFAQYGVRVPALVVSPFIPRNTIDHRLYDHASIPATVEKAFGLAALTARDASARNLLSLLTLDSPRACLRVLPDVAPAQPLAVAVAAAAVADGPTSALRPADSIDDGSLPAVVHAAMRAELELEPERKAAILQRVADLRTREDAQTYLREIRDKKYPR